MRIRRIYAAPFVVTVALATASCSSDQDVNLTTVPTDNTTVNTTTAPTTNDSSAPTVP